MLLHYSRFFISPEGIQVAFDYLSDRYPAEWLKLLAQRISEQYDQFSDQLSLQEDVLVTPAPVLSETECLFIRFVPMTDIDLEKSTSLLARVTNLQALCRSVT